jgi:L-lactate utilization protein LutC
MSVEVANVSPVSETPGKWERLPGKETIDRTISALKNRGISAESVPNREEALELVTRLIPAGAELMTASSTTLDEIGFLALLKSGDHHWTSLNEIVNAEKDPAKRAELRRRNINVDYFLGSVHAITENGETIVASASGSQIPSYAFTSKNVIWVAGTQKIVRSLEEGLRRVREHSLNLETARMKSLGYPGSMIAKILIVEREPAQLGRKVSMILVNEKLGF